METNIVQKQQQFLQRPVHELCQLLEDIAHQCVDNPSELHANNPERRTIWEEAVSLELTGDNGKLVCTYLLLSLQLGGFESCGACHQTTSSL